MKKAWLFLSFLLVFSLATLFACAQSAVLSRYQDSLVNIAAQVKAGSDDGIKIETNAAFVKTLVNALKIPYSYNFPFDSLKNVTVLKSPDNAFRVITWYLPMGDGSFRYYGAIQMSTPDGKLKLHPLMDDTPNIKDKNEVVSNKNWFGARYYDIVLVSTAGKAPYYVLLGWKGKNDKISSKIVEILSFDKNEPVFGRPVFDGKGVAGKNRVVYEYNKFNSMTLQRDHTVNLIVMEHLAPIDPSKKDQPEFYASDSSFDAFKILNGRLKFLENIELLNPPSASDEFYNDPASFKPVPVKQN